MNIFGVGLPEMALILVLALLVFGPKKLPEIGRSLAQALNSFKKAQQEFESEFKKEAEQIQKSMNAPMKASLERPALKALSGQEATTAPQNGTASAASETDTATAAPESAGDSSTPVASSDSSEMAPEGPEGAVEKKSEPAA